MDNLKNLAQYPVRLRTFLSQTRHGLRAAILTALGALAALLTVFPKFRAALREKRFSGCWLVLLIPAAVTFVLVAIISPVDEIRYIYNIAPIFALGTGFFLYLLEGSLRESGEKGGRIAAAVFLAVAALALWEARTVPPDYLYPEQAEYGRILAEYAADPCVYFSDEHFEPITEDLLQLLNFDEFYVTDQESFDGMLAYVGGAEEVVVYIDISSFWSSGYDADAILRRLARETPYKNAEPLFTTGLSATYLISR